MNRRRTIKPLIIGTNKKKCKLKVLNIIRLIKDAIILRNILSVYKNFLLNPPLTTKKINIAVENNIVTSTITSCSNWFTFFSFKFF